MKKRIDTERGCFVVVSCEQAQKIQVGWGKNKQSSSIQQITKGREKICFSNRSIKFLADIKTKVNCISEKDTESSACSTNLKCGIEAVFSAYQETALTSPRKKSYQLCGICITKNA